MSGYVPNNMASVEGEEYNIQRGSFSDGGTMERWSSRSTIRFVKLYGMYPCLWDQNQPSYKNRHVRDQAVQAIVDGMGIEGFDINACRRKIRIIRSTYWNECAKISRSAANGTQYTPKLVWFPMANQFLSRISGFKEAQCWKNDNSQETEVRNPEIEFLPSEQNNFHGQMVKTEPHPEPEESDLMIDEIIYEKTGNPVFCEPRNDDEFDVFGKSVACQLKQLPLSEALQLQMQIQTLISRQRMRHLQQQSRPHQPPVSTASATTFHGGYRYAQ